MAETESTPTTTTATALANPGPLGLCGFALTTFVLSAVNAGILTGPKDITVVIGIAYFYGGLAQLLAGMWEVKAGNTFGATAFSSYGAFWIAVGYMVQFGFIPGHPAFAIFLLGWTIFTFLLLICSFSINKVLPVLFILLFITFALLTGAEFGMGTGKLGGDFGFATAAVAWYAALAGLLTSVKSKISLPT